MTSEPPLIDLDGMKTNVQPISVIEGIADTWRRLQISSPVAAIPGFPPYGRVTGNLGSMEERLYDALASFKVRTAMVAMHLDGDWRTRLFRQLDGLMDKDEWDPQDAPPSLQSFVTFLRAILIYRPAKRPSIGASYDGNLIAVWTSDKGRLSVECLPSDRVKWSVMTTIGGEKLSGAGNTPLTSLTRMLAPYEPANWFTDAK